MTDEERAGSASGPGGAAERPGDPGPEAPSRGGVPAAGRIPLWTRIAAAVLLACVLAGAVAGAWLGGEIVRTSREEVEEALAADLDMLAPVVAREVATGEFGAVREMVAAGRRHGSLVVSVLLPSGEVVAETGRIPPIAPQGDLPEVRQALRAGVGRDARSPGPGQPGHLYLAKRVAGPDGSVVCVLRAGRALRSADAIDRELLRSVAFAALIGVPVALLVGWIAARRIARPLEELAAAADRMSRGDFARVPPPRGVAEAIRLAEALDRMRTGFLGMLRVRDASSAELAAMLASMTEGVLAVDRDGRILFANAAVADCLQLPLPPEPGASLNAVVRLPEVTAQLRRALDGHAAPETDVTLPGAAGRVLGVGAAPVRMGKAVSGAVLVLRDITVIRRLERTRLDFVANVSHELRTPLAAVMGSVETLKDLGDDEPEMRARLLDTAHRHGVRLGAIVNDLLALSQIESEGDRLERTAVPVLRSLRSAASAVSRDAETRGVRLVLPAPDTADPLVLGHEGRLEQVWTNLLANAVKYNRPGGEVVVAVVTDAPNRVAEVSVADTGQGIPAEHLPRIFERFYRVDKGRSREAGGTGLGLAIVKHIVLAHRGHLRVESTVGAGTTFRVRIPLAPAG